MTGYTLTPNTIQQVLLGDKEISEQQTRITTRECRDAYLQYKKIQCIPQKLVTMIQNLDRV